MILPVLDRRRQQYSISSLLRSILLFPIPSVNRCHVRTASSSDLLLCDNKRMPGPVNTIIIKYIKINILVLV
jgi:hypothetical protein